MKMKQHAVEIDGRKMQVWDRGPENGMCILLVHGFPLDHTMWSNQFQWLDPSWKRFRMIAPDLLGCGQSDPFNGGTSMRQIADQLAEMLDQLNIDRPIVFCGLSMGGYVGWEFVLRHVDRVSHLVACNTRAAADTPEVIVNRKKMAKAVVSIGAKPIADAMMSKLFYDRPDLLEADRDNQTRLNQVIVQTRPATVSQLQIAMAERADMTDLICDITIPTLVVSGRHDQITPAEEMESMAQAIPNAQYVLIENAAHMTPLEQGDEFNKALTSFLD